MRVNARVVIVAATAVGLAALSAGFLIDFKGFAGNVLAELAGLLFSALVAVLVVDRLVEGDRRRRWRLVSDETLRTFQDALVRAGLEMYLRLEAPRPSPADPYTMSMLGSEALGAAFVELAAQMRSRSDSEIGEPDTWLPEVESHIRLIREGVMPRLLALGDAHVVAAAAGVEGALQDLLHAVWLAKRFGGEHVARAAADLAEAMGAAARALPNAA